MRLRGSTLAKYGVTSDMIKKADPSKLYDYMYQDKYRDKAHRTGNVGDGDAYKYRGRGFLQITGQSNYAKIGKEMGVDLVKHPELLEDPAIAARASVQYWKDHKLGEKAKSGDVTAVTRGVNGGLNDLSGREANYTAKLSDPKYTPGTQEYKAMMAAAQIKPDAKPEVNPNTVTKVATKPPVVPNPHTSVGDQIKGLTTGAAKAVAATYNTVVNAQQTHHHHSGKKDANTNKPSAHHREGWLDYFERA